MDTPDWEPDIVTDDFLVTIGKKQSNSVYHVYESKSKDGPKPGKRRHHLKVFVSDLITMLKRDSDQKLIPIIWYSRNKKNS